MTSTAALDSYLARIGVNAPGVPDTDRLAQVQAAHRQNIPFENLGIRLGEGVTSDSDAVFTKLVGQERGGFCFEHNALFADMLGAMGFEARLLLARVLLGNPGTLPPRTHCLVLVRIDGEDWIADAGFGGSYAPPMRLRDGEIATSGDSAQHRLRHFGPEGTLPGSWLLERKGPAGASDGRTRSDSEWEPQYAFDLAEVALSDMALGCHWSATHPTSRFTNLTMVSRCLPDGFTSLVDRKLTLWRTGAEPEKRIIGTPEGYRALLAEEFGIALTAKEVSRLPLF